MASVSERYITQMKLRELRLQREKTLVAYAALAAESRAMAAAQGDAAALRLLYERLRQLKFASQPLHPDVANLELLLREIDLHPAGSETVSFWRERLERELARGELRAEIVYIFGKLLEESLGAAPTDRAADPEQVAAQQTLMAQFTHPGSSVAQAATAAGSPLEAVFTSIGLDTERMAEYLRYATEEVVYQRIQPDDLTPVLEQIRHDDSRDASVRREARRVASNATLTRELADALTIALDHLDEWVWPTEGVAMRACWTHTKWRLFLEEDLPNACLLQVLGLRWQNILQDILGRAQDSELEEPRKHLPNLGEATMINRHDRRLLSNAAGLTLLRDIDIWQDVVTAPTSDAAGIETETDDKDVEDDGDGGDEANEDDDDSFWSSYNNIRHRRAERQDELREFTTGDSYGSANGISAMSTALTLLNAEIELAKAAFPERALHVAKLDLKDYFPSLSHDLLLTILARLGLAERDLAFFRRYLRAPVMAAAPGAPATAPGGGPLVTQRGVYSHRYLSDFLGELVLRLFDQYVQRAGVVELIRVVDDIGLVASSQAELAKAVQAAQAFIAACGLELNQQKSGYVVIGANATGAAGVDPALAALVSRAPTWMMLTLDSAGEWRVTPMAFADYLAHVRRDLLAEPTLLPRVARYNASVTYLQSALAFNSRLGSAHRRSIGEAVARFHYGFFGDGRSIVDDARQLIRERYLEARTTITLPEAWLYWPITAGGLGLKQAVMLAESFAAGYKTPDAPRPQKARTADVSRRGNEWSRWYRSLLVRVNADAPEPNTVMETLVNDFISRGAELSSGKQQTLSTYWRWALYVYGPQILDALGSFRFLFTELVPIQLILERTLDDDELGGDGSDDE